jgi:hypothetical protein
MSADGMRTTRYSAITQHSSHCFGTISLHPVNIPKEGKTVRSSLLKASLSYEVMISTDEKDISAEAVLNAFGLLHHIVAHSFRAGEYISEKENLL